MVGVVASYEARRCLWTMFRQIPVLMVTVGPMMIACRLLEPRFGLAYGLAGGWVVFVAIFVPLTRWRWQREARPAGALQVSG